MAFRWVAILPCILVFIFGTIAMHDRMQGGYKAVHLTGADGKYKELAAAYPADGHAARVRRRPTRSRRRRRFRHRRRNCNGP